MSSIAKTQPRSKKTTRLGSVQVMRPNQYEAFDVDKKVEGIRALIPLGLMHVREVLKEEVSTVAGACYARKTLCAARPTAWEQSWQRAAGRATAPPADSTGGNTRAAGKSLCRRWSRCAEGAEVAALLLKRVLDGISCRNEEAAAAAVPGTIGLSSSTVSRTFTRPSGQRLQTLQDRDLSE